MRIQHNRMIIVTLLFIGILVALQACSTFSFKPAEDVLRERVNGMMEAKVNNDWGKVYDYFSPEYKKIMPKDNFLRINRNIYFTNYSIVSIEILPSGKEAKVVVSAEVSAKGFDFPASKEKQTWVKSGWNWYLVVPKPGKNPMTD